MRGLGDMVLAATQTVQYSVVSTGDRASSVPGPLPSNYVKTEPALGPPVKSVKTEPGPRPPRQIRQSGETARQNHRPLRTPTTTVSLKIFGLCVSRARFRKTSDLLLGRHDSIDRRIRAAVHARSTAWIAGIVDQPAQATHAARDHADAGYVRFNEKDGLFKKFGREAGGILLGKQPGKDRILQPEMITVAVHEDGVLYVA